MWLRTIVHGVFPLLSLFCFVLSCFVCRVCAVLSYCLLGQQTMMTRIMTVTKTVLTMTMTSRAMRIMTMTILIDQQQQRKQQQQQQQQPQRKQLQQQQQQQQQQLDDTDKKGIHTIVTLTKRTKIITNR